MTDPIADMLTRIRNANTAKLETVEVPMSNIKLSITQILEREGYVKKVEVVGEDIKKSIVITMNVAKNKEDRALTGIKRISKPGLRVYASKDELPRVLGGLGIAIISTNKGIITDKEARRANVGGEVLAFVW